MIVCAFLPAPFFRTWQFLICNGGLSPTVPRLIHCTFDIFFQSSLSSRYVIYLPSPGKQQFSTVIDLCVLTCSVIKQNHEPLQMFHSLVRHESESAEINENLDNLRECLPYFPSCFLSTLLKEEAWEKGRGLNFSRPSLFAIVCIIIHL